jgi:hypothetical protein
MTPMLTGWATQSALQDRRAPGRFASARIEVRLDLEGAEPLRSRLVAGGRGLPGTAAGEAGFLLGVLEGVVGEVPRVEGLAVDVELREREVPSTLGRVKVYDPLLEPGRRLRGRVEVLDHENNSTWVEFDLPVPERLHPGRYRLRVTDGATAFVDEISRTGDRFQRMDLEALRTGLELRNTADRIVAVLYGPPESVVIGSSEFRALPPSVHALLAGPGAGPSAQDTVAEKLASWEGKAGEIVVGEVSVDLRTRAPIPGGYPVPEDDSQNGKAQ